MVVGNPPIGGEIMTSSRLPSNTIIDKLVNVRPNVLDGYLLIDCMTGIIY